VPGIIVSRPIFNTLFKKAHDEGLSINAFLTKLLENSESGAAAAAPAGVAATALAEPIDKVVDAGGSERVGVTRLAEAPQSLGANGSATAEMGEAEVSGASNGHSYIGETEKNLSPASGAGSSKSSSKGSDPLWDKVVSMEGHRFSTSRGKKFTYKVTGEYVVVKNSSARIPRSQFAKAQKMWPVTGPSQLVGVYAPSVVWAMMKELIQDEAA
jgi:hypothetical protein